MSEHVVAGLVGGFVGTLVLSMGMMPMMKGQPSPTQLLASKFLNKKTPEQNKMLGMMLHFFYGTIAGLIFVLVLDALYDPALGTLSTGEWVGWALAWGVLLWLGSFMWQMILGQMKQMMAMPAGAKMKMMGGFFVLHLVYGAVLGGIAGAMVG